MVILRINRPHDHLVLDFAANAFLEIFLETLYKLPGFISRVTVVKSTHLCLASKSLSQ